MKFGKRGLSLAFALLAVFMSMLSQVPMAYAQQTADVAKVAAPIAASANDAACNDLPTTLATLLKPLSGQQQSNAQPCYGRRTTKTKCIGVVLLCRDYCGVAENGGRPISGWYPCGACFGFRW
jgi:hypothetical protein